MIRFWRRQRRQFESDRLEEILRDAKPEPIPLARETSDRIFEQAFADSRTARRTTEIRQGNLAMTGLCLGTVTAITLLPSLLNTAGKMSAGVPGITATEQTLSDSTAGALSKPQDCYPPLPTRLADIAQSHQYKALSKAGDLLLQTKAWEAPIRATCGFSTFGLYIPQPASDTEEPEEGSLLICIVHKEKPEPAETAPLQERATPVPVPELHADPPECVVLASTSVPPADSEAEANLISMFHPEAQRPSLTLATITML